MPCFYTMWSNLYRFIEICNLCVLVFLLINHPVSAILCSQCDSLTNRHCESVPPTPTPCAFCDISDKKTGNCLNYTEYHFCITMKRYINDSLVRMTRACNPISIGADCRPAKDKDGNPVKLCFDSCITDGCNKATTLYFPRTILQLCMTATLSGYIYALCNFIAS